MSRSELYSLRLVYYNKLISQLENVDRKGKSMPYTSINGHMFSFLDKEGEIGLRLPKDLIENLKSLYHAEIMIQHGRTMKEFVKIPQNLIDNLEALTLYFQNSIDYVSSLKPKVSKKK